MAIYLGPSMKPKDAQKVREFDAELEKRYLDLLTNSANVYHLFEPNDPARPLLEELVLQDGRYPTLDEYLGKQRTDSTIRSVTNDLKQRVVAKFARQLDERANKHLQSEITGSLEHVGTDLTGSQAESLQKEAESRSKPTNTGCIKACGKALRRSFGAIRASEERTNRSPGRKVGEVD